MADKDTVASICVCVTQFATRVSRHLLLFSSICSIRITSTCSRGLLLTVRNNQPLWNLQRHISLTNSLHNDDISVSSSLPPVSNDWMFSVLQMRCQRERQTGKMSWDTGKMHVILHEMSSKDGVQLPEQCQAQHTVSMQENRCTYKISTDCGSASQIQPWNENNMTAPFMFKAIWYKMKQIWPI